MGNVHKARGESSFSDVRLLETFLCSPPRCFKHDILAHAALFVRVYQKRRRSRFFSVLFAHMALVKRKRYCGSVITSGQETRHPCLEFNSKKAKPNKNCHQKSTVFIVRCVSI